MLHSIKVKDYMNADVVTFLPETDVLNAIHQLIQHKITGAPVVNHEGDLMGMLSEKDCLKVAVDSGYHEQIGGKVSEFMSDNLVTVEADESILTVARMFIEAPFKLYPVVTENRLIGSISRRDILRAIEEINQPNHKHKKVDRSRNSGKIFCVICSTHAFFEPLDIFPIA